MPTSGILILRVIHLLLSVTSTHFLIAFHSIPCKRPTLSIVLCCSSQDTKSGECFRADKLLEDFIENMVKVRGFGCLWGIAAVHFGMWRRLGFLPESQGVVSPPLPVTSLCSTAAAQAPSHASASLMTALPLNHSPSLLPHVCFCSFVCSLAGGQDADQRPARGAA